MTDPRGNLWSEDDTAYLREYYAQVGSKAAARHLDRSEIAVRIKASRMGLRVSAVVPRGTSEAA